MKQIEIIIDTKGEMRLETKGFTGVSCRESSRFLEQALGDCTSERVTTEFHEGNVTSQHHQQRG